MTNSSQFFCHGTNAVAATYPVNCSFWFIMVYSDVMDLLFIPVDKNICHNILELGPWKKDQVSESSSVNP